RSLLAGRTARLCTEVVSDAPLLTSLNRHVREIRLPRCAANLDAMHARLEIERGDRRRRAVVPVINVKIAVRRYREEQLGGAAGLRRRNARRRLCCPRCLLPRGTTSGCALLGLDGGQTLSLC